MKDTVRMVDGKYQIAIPWRQEPESLPNNKSTALQRLKSLKIKLQKNDHLREQYTQAMEKYLSDGHDRQLKANELNADQEWYLPHHPVFKRSDPSKCRVVFDCASKHQGISLNDAIMQGPNFMNSLAGVLIRFRKEQIALVGYIKAMFHQCKVTPRDQKLFRLLWCSACSYICSAQRPVLA